MIPTSGRWHERWAGVLDDGSERARRARQQGGAYQRSGRVTDVRVTAGAASGRVQGARATPFLVEITVGVLDDAAWSEIVGLLAAEVRHGARLLAGHTPEGLEDELAARGIALFPERVDVTSPCGERQPCPHAAAVWHAVGDLLAADPFVLFRLRGRGRQRLLAELASARRPDGRAPVARGIPLDAVDVTSWHRASSALDDLQIPPAHPPPSPAPALRLLGDPPGWPGGVGAWDLFWPLVAEAGEYAAAEDAAAQDAGAQDPSARRSA